MNLKPLNFSENKPTEKGVYFLQYYPEDNEINVPLISLAKINEKLEVEIHGGIYKLNSFHSSGKDNPSTRDRWSQKIN